MSTSVCVCVCVDNLSFGFTDFQIKKAHIQGVSSTSRPNSDDKILNHELEPVTV